ncbi:hypothetical protein HJG60_011590 [Phyllostomus discolor]|uniref:Uncharacterized protein n=1 Tax=Phyllostomus discolor TaxID=89673 RepID=A0A833ZVK4_9CHIR|nr:hypothetical protein HJG60_011590 [Phyllostomus discolor]
MLASHSVRDLDLSPGVCAGHSEEGPATGRYSSAPRCFSCLWVCPTCPPQCLQYPASQPRPQPLTLDTAVCLCSGSGPHPVNPTSTMCLSADVPAPPSPPAPASQPPSLELVLCPWKHSMTVSSEGDFRKARQPFRLRPPAPCGCGRQSSGLTPAHGPPRVSQRSGCPLHRPVFLPCPRRPWPKCHSTATLDSGCNGVPPPCSPHFLALVTLFCCFAYLLPTPSRPKSDFPALCREVNDFPESFKVAWKFGKPPYVFSG